MHLALAGGILVQWPPICKHFGWGDHTKLCGPYVMSADTARGARDERCRWHDHASPLHHVPKVKGKEFELRDHQQDLEKLGLTRRVPELAERLNKGQTPPGKPKRVGKVDVYPTPHFGQPARE